MQLNNLIDQQICNNLFDLYLYNRVKLYVKSNVVFIFVK